MQLIGASGSPGFEFIQDSYGKQNGSFGSSKIIYQWDGSFTTSRKRQAYRRYPNGYIVNKNSTGDFDTERFLRNFNGSLLRRDTLNRKLVRTFQVIDTTNSFLTTSADGGFELIDWFDGDTIQTFNFSSLINDYQGSLDPNNWEIFEYHNDGQYIYLRAAESHLIQSYGYDIKQSKWLGNARFQGALPGNNFDVSKIIDVKGGYIYLATQTKAGSSDIDLLVCQPLSLNYSNSLFLRTLGANETKTGALELFPNPVNDRLRLNFGSTFTEFQFFNMAGSLVGRLPYSEEDTYSTSFLSPGVYSVAIMDGGKVLAERKLMKKLN